MSYIYKNIVIFCSFFILFSIISDATSSENCLYNTKYEPKTYDINNNIYNGYLRIYIVEPISRWNMYDDRPYHNGFLDFAYEAQLSIKYGETFENSKVWQGDINKDNVFVIATIFNPVENIGYAYPPNSKPFEAHYVDAAAVSYPNQTVSNIRTEEITHSVFIEEGTATWCKNCPSMANLLHNISKKEEYNFYYAAMITDMNKIAENHMKNEYNIYGYPTIFLDGGKNVLLGGGYKEETIESLIDTCARSDVHELDLNLSVEWLGDGKLRINYNITNLEEANYQIFDINNFFGGIKKVHSIVENIGGTDVTNVKWKISVCGGFINGINITTSGVISNFPSGCKKIINTKTKLFQIYGFGRIDVVVQVGASVKTSSGFVIGRFVFVK